MTTTNDHGRPVGDYTIDPTHSQIGFIARHAMVTKVRGSFNEFTGTAHLDAEVPARSSVAVTIQAASIDTRNTDRDAHLRGNDFFQMDKYPEMTFSSTEISWTSSDTVNITGDLTIKGVTRAVTIPFSFAGRAMDPYGNVRIGLEGSTTINRRDFGVTWNAALETGGVLIGDTATETSMMVPSFR